MRLSPAQRKAAFDQMGNGYQKQMFLLGVKLKAVAWEATQGGVTEEQKRRLESELLPATQRIKSNQRRADKRGLMAIQIQRATSIFDDIFGENWHPRPDNPVQRECQNDLLITL